jgi:hypothetical protein
LKQWWADLGLTKVSARRGSQDIWREALRGWNMKDSQIVKQWEDRARAEGEVRGEAEMLLHILEKKFKQVPKDLQDAIFTTNDKERLYNWADLAVSARSLKSFRKQADV